VANGTHMLYQEALSQSNILAPSESLVRHLIIGKNEVPNVATVLSLGAKEYAWCFPKSQAETSHYLQPMIARIAFLLGNLMP
jgi:hypothetical protein